MDSLISVFKNICVKSIDDDLDDLISKLEKSEIIDCERNLSDLTNYYSKMVYVKQLLDRIPVTSKLLKCMDLFMELVDKQTQFYLREINFEFYSDPIEIEIKNIFEESLNIQDTLQKFNLILKGYSKFVEIVESIIDRKISLSVEPEFQHKFKRQKY
jgi:hypothetical protein